MLLAARLILGASLLPHRVAAEPLPRGLSTRATTTTGWSGSTSATAQAAGLQQDAVPDAALPDRPVAAPAEPLAAGRAAAPDCAGARPAKKVLPSCRSRLPSFVPWATSTALSGPPARQTRESDIIVSQPLAIIIVSGSSSLPRPVRVIEDRSPAAPCGNPSRQVPALFWSRRRAMTGQLALFRRQPRRCGWSHAAAGCGPA